MSDKSLNGNQRILGDFMLAYIHRKGRVMPYEDMEDVVMREEAVKMILEHDPQWTIDDLVLQYSDVFYMFVCEGDRYIALSRDYAYLNPRLAKCLDNVSDKAREAIIRLKLDSHVDCVRVSELASNFKEYALAKVSLTILEILSAIARTATKKRDKIVFKRLVEKCKNLSAMSHAVLHFCSKGDYAEVVAKFLELFGCVFQMDGSLLSVDMYLFDGLVASYELDLLMSYAGECMLRGLSSIDMLTEELTDLACRAKFRFTKVTREMVTVMLMNRKDFCFVPGDGTAWLLVSPDMPGEQSRNVINFYIEYINENVLHYMQCLDVIQPKKSSLLKGYEGETSLSLSALLYGITRIFTFIKGYITLTLESKKLPMTLNLKAIEVPTHVVLHTFPTNNTRVQEGIGIVSDIGMKSAVIRFSEYFSEIIQLIMGESMALYAFCSVSDTMFGLSPINDFTSCLCLGDCVRFQYHQPLDDINIHYPIYNVVMNISAFHDPKTGDLENKIHVGPNFTNYRVQIDVPSDKSSDSEDTVELAISKPSTSKGDA